MVGDRDRTGAGRFSRRQVLAAGLGGAGLAAVGTAGCAAPSANRGSAGPGGGAVALAVNGLARPLGVDPDDLFFSWRLDDPTRGVRQHAYQLTVAAVTVNW